jgi:uncharacterized protein
MPGVPQIISDKVRGRERKLTYMTPDRVRLSGILTRSSSNEERGSVILAHGLNNNKDEDGNFVTLSNTLSEKGYNVFRFDFRAHGESEGKSEDMTVSGELKDFETSAILFENLVSYKGKFVVVASSFGAPSTILYTSSHPEKVKILVLWNPVLDFSRTFLKSETPWGKTFFNDEGYRHLRNKGYVQIPETNFRLGKDLVKEFEKIRPYELLSKFQIPVLTIHGTKDTDVPYAVSKEYGAPNPRSAFISLRAEHTFPGFEGEVIAQTLDWISKND